MSNESISILDGNNKELFTNPMNIPINGEFKSINIEPQIIDSISKLGIEEINQNKRSEIIFDLSKTTYYDLGTLLWFITYLYKLKSLGIDIQLKLPDCKSLSGRTSWDFLNRWKFFDALEECVDSPMNLLMPEQLQWMGDASKYKYKRSEVDGGNDHFVHGTKLLEIIPIRSDPSKYKIQDDKMILFIRDYYDKIIESSLKMECGWDYRDINLFVYEILGEGIRNSFKYSEGTFTIFAIHFDTKNLKLSICDNGNGIPDVLRKAFVSNRKLREMLSQQNDIDLIKFYTDQELIKLSTNPNVTSDPNSEGMGLFHLKRIVLSWGGELRIRSGNACVDFSKNGIDDHKEAKLLSHQGTLLRVMLPLKTQQG
jgi:hypothetical protein